MLRTLLAVLVLCGVVSAQHSADGVVGQVQDSTGAIIPSARVELQRPNGSLVSETETDSGGHFQIPTPVMGDYRLTVALAGFEPLIRIVKVGKTALPPLTLTMALAMVSTSVDVNAGEAVDVAAPENNKDAASISSDDMKTLPILDGDVVATLSAFLDAGAAGEGGATLIVDGVETSALGVSPSAVDRISINEDPYSAQYRQPGRGQVEIITKNAATKFHGAFTFTIRDSRFDATNYFATSKPPDQRRTYEGFFTGPLRPLHNTTFLFSIFRPEEDRYQEVVATTAPGVTTAASVAAPYRNVNMTMKVAHQINDHHSAYLLYRFFDTSNANSNVGGLTLAEAGFTNYYFDQDITFHDDLIISSTKLHQLNVRFERNLDRTVSNQQTPSIIVQGAFQGGGAQADTYNTENNPDISDIMSWTHKKHQMKFGLQLSNQGRRVLDDETNRQGTYTFASLAAYQQNAPSTFSQQQGQSHFVTSFDTPSAFFLDQIQATARLTVTPGVRYDFQNAFTGTRDAFLPRLSLAYVLDKQHGLVVRTGGGTYMRRVGVNVGQQLARYQNAAERSVLLTSGVTYPETGTLAAQPPNLFNYAPNLKAPMQGYFGLSVERQLTKKSTVTVGYEGYRGWHALRSVDVNAPLPPFTSAVRPNPNYGQILQQQSGGTQKSDGLVVSYRGRISNVFSGFAQYNWQHADSNTTWSTFTPQNQYDPNAEWSRADYDQRQRFNLFGTLYPDKPLNLGVGFYANTPTPYSETTGTDDYHTGFFNARPAGVGRNSLQGGGYQDLQVRLGYTRKLQPKLKDLSPTIAASLSSFNTLNRVNYQNYVGVVTSEDFMKPTSASNARRFQLGVAYTF